MVDFPLKFAALCRCSMVPCVLKGYRCGVWWGAIRGGRHGKLVDSILCSDHVLFGQRIFTLWVCKALLPGDRRFLQLSAPGWLIRLCDGRWLPLSLS